MLEVILDASQIELFERCPRAWYYAYVQNLTPLHSKSAFSTGSYYHEVLALYYSLPLPLPQINKPETELYQIAHRKLGQVKNLAERLKAAVDFAASPELHTKYHIKDADAKIFHRKRIVDYLFNWSHEDEGLNVIAVEQGFSTLLYEDVNKRYILEGKIDLVFEGKPYGYAVMDHKTQSRYDDRWEFNHQVMNYMAFTKADYFVYNYIGLQDKLPLNGMRRMLYKPPPGTLEQWKSEVRVTFDEMTHYKFLANFTTGIKETEETVYPRKRSACDASKYGLCQFHKLCSVPDDSIFKESVLSHYKPKESVWRAWT